MSCQIFIAASTTTKQVAVLNYCHHRKHCRGFDRANFPPTGSRHWVHLAAGQLDFRKQVVNGDSRQKTSPSRSPIATGPKTLESSDLDLLSPSNHIWPFGISQSQPLRLMVLPGRPGRANFDCSNKSCKRCLNDPADLKLLNSAINSLKLRKQ